MSSPRIGAALLALAILGASPLAAAEAPPVVNDVTQLNPIAVERIVIPKTVAEVQRLVREHHGPISIGGARHSMGGQIATEQSLFLDMRQLARVVALDVEHRTITVEAGITWRKIQEAIDPHGLAVKVMQSYANFTVGGSLSVNAHGRYVGQGSLIGSVRSVKIVLADGTLVEASREANAELFRGAIGGYGALGVIVEATLDLARNQKIERQVKKLAVADYKGFFLSKVKPSKTAIFHNADLYPPAYDTVMAMTWSVTERPVTVPERLGKVGTRHWSERLAYFWMSEIPFGKQTRAKVIDPLRLRGDVVVWRNHEASYDAGELEPISRTHSTYVLEEYFIPVERFDEFVPKLRDVLSRHGANVVNVSIRHAEKDDESLMAWAREESFAFVVYYKQRITKAARAEVGAWTRELIDAALSVGGTYYLPYQIHATDEQFRRAYPRAEELFALKRKVDPEYRFRNKLWDRYYRPEAPMPAKTGATTDGPDAAVRAKLRTRPTYLRDASQTYLTLPEWYIVYSADELSAFIHDRRPSNFPYFRSIAQFWRIYAHVLGETWGSNWGYQLMICVIGPSYSAEYFVKGVYENVFGRLAELTVAPWGPWQAETPEDRFVEAYARDYAAFMHSRPWFEFSFAERRRELWKLDGALDRTIVRRAERKVGYSGELLFKTAWGWLVGGGSQSTYEPEAEVVEVWVRKEPRAEGPEIAGREGLDGTSELVRLPRYEPFTAAVVHLAAKGVRFVEVAGNDKILATLIAPATWSDSQGRGRRLLEWTILTERDRKRVAMTLDVGRLHEVLPSFAAEQVTIDHLYDF